MYHKTSNTSLVSNRNQLTTYNAVDEIPESEDEKNEVFIDNC